MTCKQCKKMFCFENPSFQNKCGGWTAGSWKSVGKKRQGNAVCTTCKEETKKNNNSQGSKEDSSASEDEGEAKENPKMEEKCPSSGSEMFKIQLTLARMEGILTEVRDHQKALQSAVDFLSKQYDTLFKEQKKINEEMKKLKKEVSEMDKKLEEKEETISDLQKRLLESETYVRNRNIEIHGVEEHEGEDVEDIVCQTAAALGVQLRKDDIDATHRVFSRNTTAPRPIVAQLISRKKRAEMLSQRRTTVLNKQVNKRKDGNGRVFVYEQIPYYLKDLKWKAKQKAEEKGWQFVWIVEGKLFARKGTGNSKAIRIVSERDLEMIK